MADNTNSLTILETDLLNELSHLIEQSKQQVTVQANSALTILFWQIGFRINETILQNKRAEYGKQIVVTLSRQLSWSHFLAILPIKNTEAKFFYAHQVSNQLMSVRDLRKQIATKTYERAAIANIQTNPSEHNLQYTFKDPYLLDFLNLGNTYLEKDLEQAILFEIGRAHV